MNEPIGRIRPKHSKEIKASPWAIHFWQPSVPDWTVPLQRTAELGVKYARFNVNWSMIEVEKGRYDFGKRDQAVDFFVANGIEIFGNIGSSNRLYTPGYDYGSPFGSEESSRAWRVFVEAAVTRYKGKIRLWEVHNEPNHPPFWQPRPDAKAYAQFLIEASKLIKALDPENKILVGGLTGIDLAYAETFLAQGTALYFDAFLVHPYRDVPEQYRGSVSIRVETELNDVHLLLDGKKLAKLSIKTEYEALRTLLARAGSEAAIWQGECGMVSDADSIHFTGGKGPFSETIQAKHLLRRMLTDWLCGAKVSTYFNLVESSSRFHPHLIDHHPDTKHGINKHGLLVNESLRPKPGYFALQHLCSVFDGVLKAEMPPCQLHVHTAGSLTEGYQNRYVDGDDLCFYAFTSASGRSMFAYWLPCRMYDTLTPGAVDVKLAGGLEDPVLIDMVGGEVYRINHEGGNGQMRFGDLPLADYPLVLADGADVALVAASHAT